MLLLASIVRRRLSANHVDVLNLKISITISSWFLASIEATKNMLLGYVSKIPLANQFTVFYIFDLFDLLILIPGAHSYIVLV